MSDQNRKDFLKKVLKAHPDKGGNSEDFIKLIQSQSDSLELPPICLISEIYAEDFWLEKAIRISYKRLNNYNEEIAEYILVPSEMKLNYIISDIGHIKENKKGQVIIDLVILPSPNLEFRENKFYFSKQLTLFDIFIAVENGYYPLNLAGNRIEINLNSLFSPVEIYYRAPIVIKFSIVLEKGKYEHVVDKYRLARLLRNAYSPS